MSLPFVATPSWRAHAPTAGAVRVDGGARRDARGSSGTYDGAGGFGAAVVGEASGDHPSPGALLGGSIATPAEHRPFVPTPPDGPPGGSTDADPIDLSELGPLEPFAADGPVTDLFLNGAAGLWVDRGGGADREPAWAADEAEVRALAVRLIARGGRHVDEATPAVDVRLGRGIRVHVVLPPVSTAGTLVSVRIPRAAGRSLDDLAAGGMLDEAQRARLATAVARRENLLITGAGGTGKTTLLAALLSEAPERERIVVIEDVAELQLAHPHAVALEARQPNLEGTGRIGLDSLLREALRMRPDRLVVGECRGAELRELLAALNTGHDGGAGTLHANSLVDVPARLEALGATAGLTAEAVARQTASAFDLVLHLERIDGRRRLAQVGRFVVDGDRLGIEAQ
ncbi:TadA family conjugal transfer-associated ATPase [Agromyces sp. NPDC127015]|uniref:TadA family conjugal transfer-associated ATPase n=1 Tax=Agromyces sp. NPDC127015 TaxID=3347108 RepID=UPI003656753F